MGNKDIIRVTNGTLPFRAIVSIGAKGDAGPSSGGSVASVNGSTGTIVLTADNVGDGTTYGRITKTERTRLAGVASGATANDTDANLKNRANHTGIAPYSSLPAYTTVKVYSQVTTGYWPTSYAADGTPTYGSSQSTGVRPSSRDDLAVEWIQVVIGGLFPPGVSSGTAGMRNGRDIKGKVS